MRKISRQLKAFLIIWVPSMAIVIAMLLASVGNQVDASEYILRPGGSVHWFSKTITIDNIIQPIFVVVGMSVFAIILVGLPEKKS